MNSPLDVFNIYGSYRHPHKVCNIMYEKENNIVCAVAKVLQSSNNQIFYMVYWCDSFKTFHKCDRQLFDLNHVNCNTGTWLASFNLSNGLQGWLKRFKHKVKHFGINKRSMFKLLTPYQI